MDLPVPERRPSRIFLGDVRTQLIRSLKLADLLPSIDAYRVPPVNIRELIPSRSEAPMAIHGGAPALPSGSRRSRRPSQEMVPEPLERLERLEREKVELQGQWMVNEKRPTETVGGKFEKPCMPLTPRGGGPPHRPGRTKRRWNRLDRVRREFGSPIDPRRMRWIKRRRKFDTRRA